MNITQEMFQNYLTELIGRVYKILPMKEDNIETLKVYIKDLQDELMGCTGVIKLLNNDSDFISILSRLQFLIESKYDNRICKRHVFKCIEIINKLKNKYQIL